MEMRDNIKRVLRLILIVGLLTIGMQACGESTDTPHINDVTPEEPAITIINDSTLDISIHYNLDTGVDVEAIIDSGEEYDIESGVTSVTIDGVYL